MTPIHVAQLNCFLVSLEKAQEELFFAQAAAEGVGGRGEALALYSSRGHVGQAILELLNGLETLESILNDLDEDC